MYMLIDMICTYRSWCELRYGKRNAAEARSERNLKVTLQIQSNISSVQKIFFSFRPTALRTTFKNTGEPSATIGTTKGFFFFFDTYKKRWTLHTIIQYWQSDTLSGTWQWCIITSCYLPLEDHPIVFARPFRIIPKHRQPSSLSALYIIIIRHSSLNPSFIVFLPPIINKNNIPDTVWRMIFLYDISYRMWPAMMMMMSSEKKLHIMISYPWHLVLSFSFC